MAFSALKIIHRKKRPDFLADKSFHQNSEMLFQLVEVKAEGLLHTSKARKISYLTPFLSDYFMGCR
jgi:hypothetical protein